jgi:hypothetical protein
MSQSFGTADPWDVFIRYSRASSLAQASWLHQALTAQGLRAFKDDQAIQAGDCWLERIDAALSSCRHFVVLLGTEGLTRWVGGETSVALSRHFGAQQERDRLQIVPVLMDETPPSVMRTFLAQFQSLRWPASQAEVPANLITAITQGRKLPAHRPRYEGCPYRGLAAFQMGDAAVFFGRERDLLHCLERLGDPSPRRPGAVMTRGPQYLRWLSIVGGSGAGKSSLMRAGLMPLIAAGALSARTAYDDWVMTEPMLPGSDPLSQLAQVLSAALLPDAQRDSNALTERFQHGNDGVLRDWLSDRLADHPQRAVLLVIDQFEVVFVQAPAAARIRFDALLASATCAAPSSNRPHSPAWT